MENEGSQPESFVLSLSVFDVAVVVNQDSAIVYILDDDEGKYQNNGKTCL